MKPREQRPQWFRDILNRAMNRVGHNVADLATHLNIPYSSLNEVINGKTQCPKITILEPLLKFLNEPLPGEDRIFPENKAHATPVAGHVSAGLVSWPGDAPHSGFGIGEFIHINLDDWKKSYQECTDPSETFVLKIEGDSMYPDYCHGDFIICKKLLKTPDEIKNGTPCIFEQDGQYTFKLFRKLGKNKIVGEPLNRCYDMILFEGHFSIPYVVVGQIRGVK